jgi:hypothetical protein
MVSRGLYLYCLARPELPAEALDVDGVDGDRGLFLQRHRRIAAVLGEVDLDELTGPDGESHLQDLAWLTPRVLRHEAVVERVLGYSPVLPARFATIFTSPARIAQLLEANHDLAAAFLDRTAGAREWSVKLYVEPVRTKEKLLGDSLAKQAGGLASSPGTRYLQERKLRADADAALRRWLGETCGRLRDELRRRAPELVERNPLASTSPDNPGEMVANWAFLVPDSEVEGFRTAALDAVRPFEDQGLSCEFAGPFPPYSFAPTLAPVE